jgi:2-keto-4-pentenoate hydratase/2-oxohepta-3-ene-1,7-dioic acid hydratase in catechol pathway
VKLTNFYENGKVHVGVITAEGVSDLTEAVKSSNCEFCQKLGTMESLIAAGEKGIKEAAAIATKTPKKDPNHLTYAPVVSAPEKIFCVGLNYLAHATEEKEALPAFPEIFSKYNNVLAAHQETIPMPAAGGQFDYEAELVVVIGKQGKCVALEDAMDYVFGYTCGNDISAREQQFRVTQWLVGKSCDKFGPVGPCIVTKDAIDGGNLSIRLWCNGELRQSDNTKNLLFNIPTLVSYLSQYTTLKPGDLIFTGTCAGCITGITDENGEHPWLKTGDEVVIEIEGIGKLRNVIA